MSYLAAAISCTYTTASVLTTFLIACSSCFIISVFAICGCVDFTRCWTFFLFATIGFILFSFTCSLVYVFFGPQKVLHTVYGGIAAVLFMLYLAFDTQMVMGSRRFALSPEEYIFATTQLYMDLVSIFLILLELVGERE
ncbi:Fas apoptotic inhibitory molecule 2 [Fasciolopsis buskii]|uniref:Fas apoptotic inhibitory molecule 2 n=1 Tax=Fasciolopsis buskii TaxID=27845 RepID=A0A8E0RSV6_9TREM|nr:Fas apoptotic inhibitory molecule 2 [Fasciolopsis buski]